MKEYEPMLKTLTEAIRKAPWMFALLFGVFAWVLIVALIWG